jgi:hypothetical protein
MIMSQGTAILIGGAYNDSVTSSDATRTAIMGDIGHIQYRASSVDAFTSALCFDIISIQSTPSIGQLDGNDTIVATSDSDIAGSSIAIGGGGMDNIVSNGTILTILVGDYADVRTIDITNHLEISMIANVHSTYVSTGDIDSLTAIVRTDAGRTIAIGGANDDLITVATMSHVHDGGDVSVCGDNCDGNASSPLCLTTCPEYSCIVTGWLLNSELPGGSG